jgi:cytochrome c oxidase subunit 2
MKPGEELKDGPPIHGNTRLEVIWTAIPSALVIALVSYSFVVLHENEEKPPGREVRIAVTGQQFFWDYKYPTSVTGGAPLRSYDLYLPEGESVNFEMHSKDVIHAFWIPAFRLQKDVVPGITTRYRVTPSRLGTYPIVCNLLCGVGHSLMRSTVHVVTPAQFEAWIQSQSRVPSAVATG